MQICPYSFTIIEFKVLFLYRAHVQNSTSQSFARILVCKFELNAVLRMLLNQYSGNKAPDACYGLFLVPFFLKELFVRANRKCIFTGNYVTRGKIDSFK